MAEDVDFTLFPPWKEGLKRFNEAGYKAGDVIEREWFYDAFGIEMLKATTPFADAERLRLQFLSAFELLREHLLIEYQVALATIRGFGYRVLPPTEQTKWAETEGMDDIKSAARKMGVRLTNVDLTTLDDGHRKENADALARLSMLRGMVRKIAKT